MRIDLALLLGAINSLGVFMLAIAQGRAKRRTEKIRAYEAVYEDACFVLEHPFRRRDELAKARQYKNDDPALEAAVRSYLDAHWMERVWSGAGFIPANLKSDDERHAFGERVRQEAAAFERELFGIRIRIRLSIPERSPVYHLDDNEVNVRLTRILRYVGSHLSLFSPAIRKHWETAKSRDALEVRQEYERGLRVCPDFFAHNPRGFDDPFFDLPQAIRQEYRRLVKPRRKLGNSRAVWKLRRAGSRIGGLLSSLRHPITTLHVRRKLRRALGQAPKQNQ
jgi:hypothetical protein